MGSKFFTESKIMVNIQGSQINPPDFEGCLQELTVTDTMVFQGGQGSDFNRLLEFAIAIYAINSIESIVNLFRIPVPTKNGFHQKWLEDQLDNDWIE